MDFLDLIRIGRDDPEYLESILAEKKKLAKFELTSAELDVLKKLDPETIRTIVDGIEKNIRLRALASSQACTGGTNACKAMARPEMSLETPTKF